MTRDIYKSIESKEIQNGNTIIGVVRDGYYQYIADPARALDYPQSGQVAEQYNLRFHRQTG